MFGVPLILIFLKEPLTNLVEKKSQIFPEQKGMFFVQSFFELFEVLLSYLSNTLSFLRIGAFAVSHAAMMEVVLMLAGATEGGSPNWIVVVLGNIFVCAMEARSLVFRFYVWNITRSSVVSTQEMAANSSLL